MLKIPQAAQILPLSLFALLAVSSPSYSQSYETFSVKASNNQDKALNTNWNFRKIDGTPRMSIFKRDDSDPDQQFERIRLNNGSFRLRHRRTGLCLNAHYLANGREINLWGCSDSDPDQHFDLLVLGDGSNLIRRRDTNLCVDSPSRNDGGIVHLWTCNADNANQKWRSSNPPQTLPDNGNVVIRPSIINRTFGRGEEFVTSNRYKFVFQRDANLVLYTPQGRAIWATGTNGTAANMLAVQTDGNVVLYANSRPVWATDTAGNPGAYLAIQTDGNVVVYRSNNVPIFNTGTVGGVTRTFTASADWLRKTVVNPPSTSNQKLENFVRNFVNTRGVARLDRTPGWDSRGQCVTLVARYIQEVYLDGAEKTKSYAFGHGKDTARVVASTFSRFFLPVTSEGLPKRGAVVSFPQIGIVKGVNYGHTAIVMESRNLNGQRQIRIMDSNSDSRATNSLVKEHFNWINIPSDTRYKNNIYWTNPR
ncbi:MULTISPECIES: ricin-type beta-trefoil lectin domain protein [Pseudanabaena]|uniref:ricin-type beta-trefoil lectin domain protein n=1 Tax=Pseudanabaena TaxID=1152 RepID=UPI00247834AE|nr:MULTISPECIES: ricin-type beta-trefoil lectin domain protein [Pseudanabaena]MEA5485926.1 ricin-type beta-trefoil lectin domain protein [Pseudanabaena sp. CCNP1317]WGS71344.1 ricin-type beta-trefoil lectin domain protein [Pseudanabaena galeata CCNP1313]